MVLARKKGSIAGRAGDNTTLDGFSQDTAAGKAVLARTESNGAAGHGTQGGCTSGTECGSPSETAQKTMGALQQPSANDSPIVSGGAGYTVQGQLDGTIPEAGAWSGQAGLVWVKFANGESGWFVVYGEVSQDSHGQVDSSKPPPEGGDRPRIHALLDGAAGAAFVTTTASTLKDFRGSGWTEMLSVGPITLQRTTADQVVTLEFGFSNSFGVPLSYTEYRTRTVPVAELLRADPVAGPASIHPVPRLAGQ